MKNARSATEPSVVRCGPAGWAHPHWDGIVYPRPKPRGFHPLEYLADYFDAIEVDTTVHGSIRPEVARFWLRKAEHNPRFQFTAKLHRRFTHERILEDRDVEAFLGGLRVLRSANRLGCLLMQFPWSFRFTEENRDYLIRLRRAFHESPLVAEMRHQSWMHEEALGTLIDYQIGFANIDQPEHVGAIPPSALLTAGVGYVRLHGRGYGDWFRQFEDAPASEARRDYLYSLNELGEWKQRIERIRRFADSIYVVANNDAGGRSVVNALQLQALIGVGRNQAPGRLTSFYARELRNLRSDGPVQNQLFTYQRAVA